MKCTIPVSEATNDITIMKKVVDLKFFSREQIASINLVQLSLQVIFMSDFLILKLNKIQARFREGEIKPNFMKYNYN